MIAYLQLTSSRSAGAGAQAADELQKCTVKSISVQCRPTDFKTTMGGKDHKREREVFGGSEIGCGTS